MRKAKFVRPLSLTERLERLNRLLDSALSGGEMPGVDYNLVSLAREELDLLARDMNRFEIERASLEAEVDQLRRECHVVHG